MEKRQKIIILGHIALLFLSSMFLFFKPALSEIKNNNPNSGKENHLINHKIAAPDSPIYKDGTDPNCWDGVSGNGVPSDPYVIENLVIDASSSHGIHIENTRAHLIIKNSTVENGEIDSNWGIYLENCTNINITNSKTIKNNYGIVIRNSRDNSIENNNCSNNENDGIFLFNCNNSQFINNTCTHQPSATAILLSESNLNILSRNNCSSNGYGIIIKQSSKLNSVYNNTCNNLYVGIQLQTSSRFNNVSFNECHHNGHYGIQLAQAQSNKISRNNLQSNGLYGGIFIFSSASVNPSHNNTILENNCSHNKHGIYISQHCYNNSLISNNCSSNSKYGIYTHLTDKHHDNNAIFNNCSFNGLHGIYSSSSSNNTISDNICFNNSRSGICLNSSSNNNTLEHNKCFNNSIGIHLYDSSNNTIFKNIIMENINNQSYSYNSEYNNWDDGINGNYWGDYGIRYPGATNNGTIWDQFYKINGTDDIYDHFPLVLDFPLKWDVVPTDKVITVGDSFEYRVKASDNRGNQKGIDEYWINATENFQIDESGLLTDLSTLDVGNYWIKIKVNDTGGNEITATIKILVQESSESPSEPIPDTPSPEDDEPNYPPGPFTLSTDAKFPDRDGKFNLSWTRSKGATNYEIYIYHSKITLINDSVGDPIQVTKNLSHSFHFIKENVSYFMVLAKNNTGSTPSNNVNVSVVFLKPDEKSFMDQFLNFLTTPLGILTSVSVSIASVGLTILGFKWGDIAAAKARKYLSKPLEQKVINKGAKETIKRSKRVYEKKSRKKIYCLNLLEQIEKMTENIDSELSTKKQYQIMWLKKVNLKDKNKKGITPLQFDSVSLLGQYGSNNFEILKHWQMKEIFKALKKGRVLKEKAIYGRKILFFNI